MSPAAKTLASSAVSMLVVDDLCNRFEAACQKGTKPQLEEYVDAAPEAIRMRLIKELLSLEVYYSKAAPPDFIAYAQRFPNIDRITLAELIPAPQESVEPTIPGYEILGLLGRGGMGIVYKARDLRLDRMVALKMVLPGSHVSDHVVARMLAEARAVARLQHPQLVQIYDIVEYDGRPLLVFEFIEGGTLADRISKGQVEFKQAATWMENIARSIQFAHSRGIVHRDLKPSNILMTAVESPKISDFGLARQMDNDIRQTHSGMLIGTPSYMAPEQAELKQGSLGTPVDLYALGAILYEMLTGRPPFRGASILETLEMVRSQEPVSIRRLNRKVPRDLETICMKCLQKNPLARYSSAQLLADDLARFLRHESILARPSGMVECVMRWIKRNPTVSLLLGGISTATTVGVAMLLWLQADRLAKLHEHDRRARHAGIEANVLLEETISLYGKAQGADRNLGLWADAREAINRAERAADAGDAPLAIRKRVKELRAQIVQHEKNQRLIIRLAEIQASMGDDLLASNDQDFPAADSAYSQAFCDFMETEFDETDPELNAKRLGGIDATFRVELAAAIDNWRYVRFVLKSMDAKYSLDASNLHSTSRLLDPDPLRNQIRDAIDKKDRTLLSGIAMQMDPSAQPVQTINLVGLYLYWLQHSQDFSEEIQFFKKAQPFHERDFQINHNLTYCLLRADRADEAEQYSLTEIIVRPNSAAAWQDRANILNKCGRESDAIIAYLRTAALAPRTISGLELAGYLLDIQGRKEEAITVYREAAKRIVRYHPLKFTLSNSWKKHGLVDEVIAEYQKALENTPENEQMRQGLISLYFDNSRWADFLNESQHLETEPKYFAANQFFRGIALSKKGEFSAAIETLNKGIDLGFDLARSKKLLDSTMKLLSLQNRFPDILKQEDVTNEERLELALAFQTWSRRYIDALALYQTVFDNDPAKAGKMDLYHRYNAACCAVMASTGADARGIPLDEQTRSAFLRQALDFLNANIVSSEEQMNSHPPFALKIVADIQYCECDGDLDGLRDPKLLADLTSPQRQECAKLWDSVERLRVRAAESYSKSEIKDVLNRNNRQRSHWIKMSMGTTYVIQMASREYKSCLQLENFDNEVIKSSNPNGSQPNANIEFKATLNGAYLVTASSVNQTGSGAYRITIHEFPDGDRNEKPSRY